MIGYNKQKPASGGFSLLEMVVAIGIFSIVLLIMSSMATGFSSSQRRSVAEQELQSDIRFALELFSREVRTGYGITYEPFGGAGNRHSQVTFRNQHGDCVAYRFANNALERATLTSPAQNCQAVNQLNQDDYVKLTKDSTIIEIDNDGEQSSFFPRRAEPDSDAESGRLDLQGFIRVKIVARTTNPQVPPLHVRSTVTSRQVIPFPQN